MRLYSPVLQLLLLYTLVALGDTNLQLDANRTKRLATPSYSQEIYDTKAKYVVSIRSRMPRKYFGDNHFCGGSIIAEQYVLTAATCLINQRKIIYRSRVFLVVAGTPNRLKTVDNQTVNVPVAKIHVPANFTIHNTNNIAVLRLTFKFPKHNLQVGIIGLPSAPPQVGLYYLVLGWGRLYIGGCLSSKLLYIEIPLLDRKVCESLIETFMPEMLCAGTLDNSLDEDPCLGDTGAPMILDTTIYGVVSYSLGCGNGNLPSVYTDVFYHIDWIKNIINGCQKMYLVPQLILLLVNARTLWRLTL